MPPSEQGCVFDCSVTLAWFLDDEKTAFTEALFTSLSRATCWVPGLWRLEFPNALMMAVRRGRISEDWRLEVLTRAEQLPLKTDVTLASLQDISRLAIRTDLTTYDAAYLELAIRHKLPLATLDRKLLTAARKINHSVMS
jgi:predicted nucleic acid-binding protein